MTTTKSNEDDVWEAEIFAAQSKEWMRNCPHKHRCPGARYFTHLLALMRKVEQLEYEKKQREEFPDES